MPHEIVSFDEPKLQEYLGELVRKTVEDALNALLDAEADQIANAGRYERTDERQACRSGHYRRGLTTTCGEVELNVPKLRGATFASKVVERYRRRESSVEEAMMEMYLAGVSTRRIQDVSEILWGSSVSPATVSKLNREAFGAETDVFCRMGLISPDGTTIYVHPTFLYESLWNLVCLIFLAVWVKAGKRRYDGQCILIYFFWYGIGRAWIEGLRTDSLYIGSTGIRVSQALSMALALISFILLVVNARRQHKPEELYVNRVAASAAASESPAEETESNKEE